MSRPLLIKRPLRLAGLDKTARKHLTSVPGSSIRFDKNTHLAAAALIERPLRFCSKPKFVRGPAVDKFFIREIVKIAIRAPNPEIWPFDRFWLIKRPLRPLAWPSALIKRPFLIKPLRLAGLDKTAIGFDRTATAAGSEPPRGVRGRGPQRAVSRGPGVVPERQPATDRWP